MYNKCNYNNNINNNNNIETKCSIYVVTLFEDTKIKELLQQNVNVNYY